MDIQKLESQFNYNNLLVNQTLKKNFQNWKSFNKPKTPDIYSTWWFSNSVHDGLFIFLGIIKDDFLIFLEFHPNDFDLAPYDAYVFQLPYFIYLEKYCKSEIRPWEIPVQIKSKVISYIHSYFFNPIK